MTAPNKYSAAGVKYAFWGILDANANLIGDALAPTTGSTGNAMIRLLGIQTANPGAVEGEDVPVEGDDGVIAKFQFEPNDTPTFIAQTGAFDLATEALMQGTAVETLGDLKIGVYQPVDPNYPDGMLILQGQTKKQDAGVKGAKAWSGYIIPLLTSQPLGREEFAGRTAGANRLRMTTQIASRKPWAVTIATADLGTTGAAILPFSADNPINAHRFTGNNSATTFNLPADYPPVSIGKIIIHEGNGQKLTPTIDYTLSGNTITRVAGALGQGTPWYVIWEFTV